MRKLLAALPMLFVAQAAAAGPWLVGQQAATFTNTHLIGDGSNARGGEAPYYASEPSDTPTNSTIITNWTRSCSPTDFGTTCGEFRDAAHGGTEAKARFDCNIIFHEQNDPVIAPGVANGSTHDHSFFGNVAPKGAAQNVTYASLRATGYSTCYGGPLNRTLYWEPSMNVWVVSVGWVVLQPLNIVTYYICGDAIDGNIQSNSHAGPVNCSRWPRNFNLVFGFDMNDPMNSRATNALAGATGSWAARGNSISWSCETPNGGGFTAYAPNQGSAQQPYFNDGNGHATLDCQSSVKGGVTGYTVIGDASSQPCWDGKNPTSPDGRSHLFYRQHNNDTGKDFCPEGWYYIPHFEVKAYFHFLSAAEMGAAYLSSDRMSSNPANWLPGGKSFHADLFPAWDYGTGDAPGFMPRFFQKCAGLTMHLKNSDGSTYTDLTGVPHQCGYGRIDDTSNAVVDAVPPDGQGPNPVVNLNPDQTGVKRYFPLVPGSQRDVTIEHPHGM
jgi:hypothetical protein